jgi:hypothetical protein
MLDLETALLAVTAVLNMGLVFLVLRHRPQNDVNRSFAIFVGSLSIWAFLHIGFRVVASDSIAVMLLKISYVCALTVGASFYYFSIAFPKGIPPRSQHAYLLTLTTIGFSAVLLMPGFLTAGLSHEPYGRVVRLLLPDYLIFAALFLFLFIGGQVRLWGKYSSATGLVRSQLLVIAGSVTAVGLLGIYFDLVLPSPFFENFHYVWTGPVLTSIFAVTLTYAIFRYRLFNLKAAATELLVFVWWIVILVRALVTSAVVDSVADHLLLVLSAPIGALLLRTLKTAAPGSDARKH